MTALSRETGRAESRGTVAAIDESGLSSRSLMYCRLSSCCGATAVTLTDFLARCLTTCGAFVCVCVHVPTCKDNKRLYPS